MRNAFVGGLVELAERDPRVLLLTGDLGYTVLEPFQERFPDRFLNVGVAEQNMVGLATGLAEAGFVPFVYSIVPFAVLRPYEFIRNGPIMHGLPVRIVGVGGGVDYGHDGVSHYGLEDVGVLRLQPGMAVIVPADGDQARAALMATQNLPGPAYFRVGKGGSTPVPGLEGRFELGRAQVVREGSDVAIVALGAAVSEALRAADGLAEEGIRCIVVLVASVSPPPVDDLVSVLARYPLVLSVEAHYLVGGVGSLVSEVIAERGLRCRLVRCGIGTLPEGLSGSQGYLYQLHGMSGPRLVRTAAQAWRELRR